MPLRRPSQYIDTGVLLQVTPTHQRGRAGNAGSRRRGQHPSGAESGRARLRVARRHQHAFGADAAHAVPTGQTMVMGGLICENKSTSTAGLAAALPHPRHRRSFRRSDAQERPNGAGAVHHPRVIEKRGRRHSHHRRSAAPDGPTRGVFPELKTCGTTARSATNRRQMTTP